MCGINLLPWREELKKVKNRIFVLCLVTLLLISITIGLILKGLAHYFLKLEVNKTQVLETHYKQHVTANKKRESLEEKKQHILGRMKIVEQLQINQWSILKLLDILPSIAPEGLYLTEIERFGQQVFIYGSAQTNASISTFLKNMETEQCQPLFNQVKVIEVSPHKKTNGLYFKLGFSLEPE